MEAFKKRSIEMDFKKATLKMMRISKYDKLDEVLYIMFRQQKEYPCKWRFASGEDKMIIGETTLTQRKYFQLLKQKTMTSFFKKTLRLYIVLYIILHTADVYCAFLFLHYIVC